MLAVSPAARQMPDAIFVDRRENVRVIVNIGGRYKLSSNRDEQGNRREFACRALNMSTRAMLLAAPVLGPVGERVIAYFGEFGTIDGRIIRVMERCFVMSITASDSLRARLGAKLSWLDEHRTYDVPDSRLHRRIVPRRPFSTLTLASGEIATCLVIDLSASGVAVSADMVPPIGAVVAVGAVIGRVRRHFTEGFAVEFEEIQDLRKLQRQLIR